MRQHIHQMSKSCGDHIAEGTFLQLKFQELGRKIRVLKVTVVVKFS